MAHKLPKNHRKATKMKGSFVIVDSEALKRLDVVFNEHFVEYSRSHIKNLIDEGKILLNDKECKAGEKVKSGDKVDYQFEELKPLEVEPEDIDFEIVYQDQDLIVVNKPQGLVVHPCSSTKDGTLVNGLLYKIKDLSGINGVLRPGIVHRLDKNTSGLMLVAKNDMAHLSLAKQIKDKTCHRQYLALCEGIFKEKEGHIETFLERSKTDRKKMAVSDKGRKAITNYRVIKEYPLSKKSLVEFSLQTGRTHQIRVHCKSLGHPIIGDDVYGKADKNLNGQLLHSYEISFTHPRTGEPMSFEIDLPPYFKQYIQRLK